MKNLRTSRFLVVPRIEPNDTGLEVDLMPLEREHLTPDAPAGDLRERT